MSTVKTKKLLLAIAAPLLAAAVAVIPTTVSPAKANSAAPAWFYGGVTGSLINGDDCPLEVEHENLVFDIPELPRYYYSDIEEFKEYNATVTAEYTFRNPTQYDLTARMLFPYGTTPEYLRQNENMNIFDLASHVCYDITVDGKSLEKSLRHSYIPYDRKFDTVTDVGKLSDEYIEDEFFMPDTVVTKYTFEASLPTGEFIASLKPHINHKESNIVLVTPQTSYLSSWETLRLDYYVTNKDEVELYVIGEPLDLDNYKVEWSFYKRYDGGEDFDATMFVSEQETLTLEDFILAQYRTDNSASKIDYYNAVVQKLVEYNNKYSYFYSYDTANAYSSLMCWYEYELSVPAGGTVVNTVKAPIYPTIHGSNYSYEYLLSPASTWAKFGTLDITINTPYVVSTNYGLDFIRNDEHTQYHYTTETLPNGELGFYIDTSKPKVSYWDRIHSGVRSAWTQMIYTSTVGFFIMVAIAGVIIIPITVPIAVASNKRKNKQK